MYRKGSGSGPASRRCLVSQLFSDHHHMHTLFELTNTNFHSTDSRGTEKQHVADDYAKRLHIGQVECQNLIQDVVSGYISEKSGTNPPKFEFCENLNISVCNVTEKNNNVS